MKSPRRSESLRDEDIIRRAFVIIASIFRYTRALARFRQSIVAKRNGATARERFPPLLPASIKRPFHYFYRVYRVRRSAPRAARSRRSKSPISVYAKQAAPVRGRRVSRWKRRKGRCAAARSIGPDGSYGNLLDAVSRARAG